MSKLHWYRSESADAEFDDREADIPGIKGVSWASVSIDYDKGWVWEIYDSWLLDDANTLANGISDTQDQAFEAVEDWVHNRQPHRGLTRLCAMLRLRCR
jgi:hypothetical protein